MAECLYPSDVKKCALAAAQFLVVNNLVSLSFADKAAGRGEGFDVYKQGESALEPVYAFNVRASGFVDYADLVCRSCKKFVEIVQPLQGDTYISP